MNINSPIPKDLGSECTKAANIMAHFVKGKGVVDQVIPPSIIANAKGVAILSVVKVGFVWSGRAGSGIVVARLPDGGWSAPSAIGTAGMGVGGQIGAELTDFVMILNTAESVRAFSQGGNVTLGGNLSVAAGPIGRNAEASGTYGGGFTAVYSYSKTKGLFAGVSLEGSVIIERKETNASFYHRQISAKEILSGRVPPPRQAEELYRALNIKSDIGNMIGDRNRTELERDDLPNPNRVERDSWSSNRDRNNFGRADTKTGYSLDRSQFTGRDSGSSRPPNPFSSQDDPFSTPSDSPAPRRPPARPQGRITATALYDFQGERDGDLSFRKGDLIVVLKKTESQDDWWTGRHNGTEGVFPANYVALD
ncbi:uncharacterized protein BJ171DRAFT_518015 [Polychytrium aggregatum]|uniref:uncharacterized protein n=1 Tax=Polychytrium aggregatum TaxID=110093 RepID=UPI0022FE4D92|nr:uncharacterized protein BJ171DRAFT_518015 [Polychytrium aggregatum]KAI9199591.1 hypothetical protein BJ171DRAFT_518015 [Polychytrium aggregatum]